MDINIIEYLICIPCDFLDYLSNAELYYISQINLNIYQQTKNILQNRKTIFFETKILHDLPIYISFYYTTTPFKIIGEPEILLGHYENYDSYDKTFLNSYSYFDRKLNTTIYNISYYSIYAPREISEKLTQLFYKNSDVLINFLDYDTYNNDHYITHFSNNLNSPILSFSFGYQIVYILPNEEWLWSGLADEIITIRLPISKGYWRKYTSSGLKCYPIL